MDTQTIQLIIEAAKKSGGVHELTINQKGKSQTVRIGPYIDFDTFIAELEAALKNNEK